jgi:hypothetical protein
MEGESAASEKALVAAFYSIGHSLWALVSAVAGGFLLQALYVAAVAERTEATSDSAQPARQMARRTLVAPCVAMLLGLTSDRRSNRSRR